METEEISINLPGRSIKLTKIKNLEALLTDINNPDEIPCWAEIWPAARGLASYIWSNLELEGKALLDLGAGLGLPGVVAGLKGAEVTFSDFQPRALELSAWNARENGVEKFHTHLGDWRSFSLNQDFHFILASDILYTPGLNIYLEKIFLKHLKLHGCLLVAHPGRPDTLEFLNKLRSSALWEEEEHHVNVTVKGEVLPYYDIWIHVLRLLNKDLPFN